MKRTCTIPLALSLLALAACAEKPANSAASNVETTSARYPDNTMSNNVNDTSATGAATNESPNYPSHSPAIASTKTPSTGSTVGTNPNADATHTEMWTNNTPPPAKASHKDTAVPARDVNRSADASSTNGSYDNSGGAPGATAPPPPQNNAPKVTPVNQGNGSSDLKITAAIRREVVSNGDLSFTAKNVKIITNGGHVTLKGEVKTQKERDAIEGTANRVAGQANVDDQIVVKP